MIYDHDGYGWNGRYSPGKSRILVYMFIRAIWWGDRWLEGA